MNGSDFRVIPFEEAQAQKRTQPHAIIPLDEQREILNNNPEMVARVRGNMERRCHWQGCGAGIPGEWDTSGEWDSIDDNINPQLRHERAGECPVWNAIKMQIRKSDKGSDTLFALERELESTLSSLDSSGMSIASAIGIGSVVRQLQDKVKQLINFNNQYGDGLPLCQSPQDWDARWDGGWVWSKVVGIAGAPANEKLGLARNNALQFESLEDIGDKYRPIHVCTPRRFNRLVDNLLKDLMLQYPDIAQAVVRPMLRQHAPVWIPLQEEGKQQEEREEEQQQEEQQEAQPPQS